MRLIVVACDVTHPLKGSLNKTQSALQSVPAFASAQKRYDISVTSETFHMLMWPYVSAAVRSPAEQCPDRRKSAQTVVDPNLIRLGWNGFWDGC